MGYAPSPSVEVLPRALRGFQTNIPGVRVMLHDLSAEEMLSQLHEGKLDLAITVRPVRQIVERVDLRGVGAVSVLRRGDLQNMSWRDASSKVGPRLLSEPLLGYTRKDYPDYYTEVEALFKDESGESRYSQKSTIASPA